MILSVLHGPFLRCRAACRLFLVAESGTRATECQGVSLLRRVVHSRKVKIRDTTSAEQVETCFRRTVLDKRQVLDYLVTLQFVKKKFCMD